MSFLDALSGRVPRSHERKRARPHHHKRNPKERKSLSVHVDEDEIWREQFVAWRDRFGDEIHDMRLDLHGIRRLLIVICLMLASFKGLDIAGITALLAP